MEDKTPSHFKKLEPSLQKAFKKYAETAGWPEDVIDQIKVKVKDNKICLSYKPDLKSKIDDLEYGNQTMKPRPAMRRFTANIGNAVNDAAASKVIDIMRKML